MSKQLTVRCDDDIARAASERAQSRHQSLNDYIVSLMTTDLATPTMDEWLRDLATDKPSRWRGSSAELVRQDRDR